MQRATRIKKATTSSPHRPGEGQDRQGAGHRPRQGAGHRREADGLQAALQAGRNPAQPEGGIVEKNGSIHLSNLALIDPESKKPTRIGTKLLENASGSASPNEAARRSTS